MEFYILFVALIILVVIPIYIGWRRRGRFSASDKRVIVSQWKSIAESVERDPRHAVIDADKLLDFALGKRGYNGSMGDKLKASGKVFSHIDKVWHAHKVRNRIAHEVGFDITEQEARSAISAFKQALWDLGIKL